MKRVLMRALLAAIAVGAFSVTPAFAGNIALTGHDDDFHCNTLAAADCQQLLQFVTFARAGSSNPSLPVLTFDQGSLLTTKLGIVGVSFVNISTPAAVTAALFDPTKYSAFVVASDSTCGGCDNNPAMTTALVAQTTAIDNFFNAGGGIVGLAGANNAGTYYGFLPASASGSGSPPSSPYFGQTCFGTSFLAVDGDATHNFFPTPGTGGVSPLYCVAERFGNATDGTPESLVLAGGAIVTDVITTTTTGGVATPEPATLTLLGIGAATAAFRRRRRK
jgi:hypothetical protein